MNEKQAHKRTIQGYIVNKIDDKSIVIFVERKVVHQRYRKVVKRFKKYIIHDEQNRGKIGDFISAIECRPISKRKAFVLREVITKGVSL